MSEPIRVAVVDDHPIFLAGVVQVVNDSDILELVAQGGTGNDAVEIAKDLLPDVLLLDIDLPGGGIEATRAIATLCPYTKIVVLTASDRQEHVTAALEAGARGYVLKGVSGKELVTTLQSIHAGATYVTPGLAARLLTQMVSNRAADGAGSDGPRLTRREEQILDYVAEGRTNKEIARQLDLSEKTVKHYMTNIMQKLQVRNRVEAALALRRHVGE